MSGWSGAVRTLVLSALIAGALSSCAALPDRVTYTPSESDQARLAGFPDDIRFWADAQSKVVIREATERFAAEQKAGLYKAGKAPPARILALSGGGEDGAFGAGLLAGWSEQGGRPTFDIVTGVSTGSLIAPLAFVGSTKDAELKAAYTTIDKKAILAVRSIFAILVGDSLATTAPLRDMISRYVTPDLISAIAQEHAKGRRLYVITTNLDAQRPVLWDMGRIASSGHPGTVALFREVLVASAAVPGVFPPVYFDAEAEGRRFQEMHVDGGVTAQVFSVPVAAALAATTAPAIAGRKRTLYVIVNNRMEPQFGQAKRGLLPIAGRSISTLIKVHGAGGVRDLYHLARSVGADFRLAYVDRGFTDIAPTPFDKAYMNKLFQHGYELGRRGYPWKDVPPGLDEDKPLHPSAPAAGSG
ncbi:phospholipase [Vineibacter terrae]|uniref:Phospholipase n=1 Tax=Vineibacter terrae TaxID=2586908 RepID=A0A5C8P9X8_9HYPH|nr:patatin-like phospholipase family protein [Vineibacter terrae]TXL70560.1 phospholipase [Vineibacter terrae]